MLGGALAAALLAAGACDDEFRLEGASADAASAPSAR
jgi:hypothetical protein